MIFSSAITNHFNNTHNNFLFKIIHTVNVFLELLLIYKYTHTNMGGLISKHFPQCIYLIPKMEEN